MAKPSGLPEWDETQVNVTVPDATHKAQGWLAPAGVPEKPAVEYWNYWMNNVYRWVTAVNDLGILNYDNVTDYVPGAFVVASLNLYKCIIANGASSSVVSPVGDITGTWQIYSAPSTDNIIIDGGLSIWPEGDRTGVSNGDYGPALLRYGNIGTAVHDYTQDGDVPTDHVGLYSAYLDCTTNDAALGATDFVNLNYSIEGFDIHQFIGNTGVLTFRIKAHKTGIYCMGFTNSGGDRSYVVEYTISSADTWETKTVIVPFNFSGGTWDYADGLGLRITFTIAAGSNFQTTAGAWQSGNYFATSNQVNGVDSTDNDFRVTGLKFQRGAIATPFIPEKNRSIIITQTQRYVEVGGVAAVGAWSNTTTAWIAWNYKVEKRVNAVVTLNNTAPTIEDPGIATRVASGSSWTTQRNDLSGVNGLVDGFTGAVLSNPAIMAADFLIADSRF